MHAGLQSSQQLQSHRTPRRNPLRVSTSSNRALIEQAGDLASPSQSDLGCPEHPDRGSILSGPITGTGSPESEADARRLERIHGRVRWFVLESVTPI